MTKTTVDDKVLFQGQKLFFQEFFTQDELETWKVMDLYNELQSCGYKIRLQRFCAIRNDVLKDRRKQ